MIDTRDLREKSEELKQTILDSFIETFPQYEDMTYKFEDICLEEEEVESWKNGWLDEIEEIEDIERVNDEIGSEFDFGVTLIKEYEFTDYCKELLVDCGDIPKNLPFYISDNINWDGVAEDLRVDYSEIEYRGIYYLYR